MLNILLIFTIAFPMFAFAEAKQRVTVRVEVTDKGFEPNIIYVAPGKELILEVTRRTNETCATDIQIPARKIKAELPLNKPVTLQIGKLEKGEVKFGCGMNMMAGGKILIK